MDRHLDQRLSHLLRSEMATEPVQNLHCIVKPIGSPASFAITSWRARYQLRQHYAVGRNWVQVQFKPLDASEGCCHFLGKLAPRNTWICLCHGQRPVTRRVCTSAFKLSAEERFNTGDFSVCRLFAGPHMHGFVVPKVRSPFPAVRTRTHSPASGPLGRIWRLRPYR